MRPSREKPYHALLWSALIVLYSLGLFWGLPSIMTSASDSIAPLGPLAFAADFHDPNKSYIYPAIHQILLLGVYAVALLGAKFTGAVGAISGTWPYGFHNPTSVFSVLLFLSNLVSMAMAVGVLACFHQIRIFEPSRRWFGVALLGFSGVFTYYARVANMDMPYLFWWMLSYTSLWLFLFRAPKSRYLIYAGIAGALSIGTKDQSVGLLLGSGLILLLILPASAGAARNSWALRFRNATRFSIALLGSYALFAVVTNPQRWWHHVQFVTSDHVSPELPGTLLGHLQVFLRTWARLGNIVSPAGLVLCLGGFALVIRARRWRELWFVVLPGLTYYLSIIAKVRATEERYLLPLAILLCFGAGVALEWIWAQWPAPNRFASGFAALILLLQLAFGAYPITYVQLFDTKHALARDLVELVPPDSNLLIVNMVSFNLPDARVYQRYHFLHPPGEILKPLSTHGEHLFSPYTPDYHFVLSGSLPLSSDEYLRNAVQLRSWTYPAWIKRWIYVPAIYEFSLYRTAGPPP